MTIETFCIRIIWFCRSLANYWAGFKMARQTYSTGALCRQKQHFFHGAAWDSCGIVEDRHDLVQRLNFLHFILIHIFISVSFSYSTVSHKCALLKYRFLFNTSFCRKRCQTPRSTRATQRRAPTCPGSRSIGPTGCRSWSVTRTLSPPSGPAGYEYELLRSMAHIME